MSDAYDQVTAVVRKALEDAFYEGVKGNQPPSQDQVTKVVWRIVDVAVKGVRDR